MQLCAAKGFLDVAVYLIEVIRVEVDEFGDAGITALHAACNHDSLELANYLIRKGADTKYIGWCKNTPLDVFGQARLRKSLSERGLNISIDVDDEESKMTDQIVDNVSNLDSHHSEGRSQRDIETTERLPSVNKVTFKTDDHFQDQEKRNDQREASAALLGKKNCKTVTVEDEVDLDADVGGVGVADDDKDAASSPIKVDIDVDKELRAIFCYSGSVPQLRKILGENTSIDMTKIKFVSYSM